MNHPSAFPAVLSTALAFLTYVPLQAQTTDAAARRAIVQRLRHQEGTVRSAEAEFDVTTSPTKPEQAVLIRELFRQRGNEAEAGHFIIDQQGALARSYSTKWWWSAGKERLESKAGGGERSVVLAFDGQVSREVHSDSKGKPVRAAINSVESSHRDAIDRLHPFSFLYYYTNTPYSDIVEKGGAFSLTRVNRGGKPHTQVSVRHPTIAHLSFVLLFDTDNRLVERQVITKLGDDKEPRVYGIHTFMDYRPHEGAGGEPIWFPRRALYSYIVGRQPNGALLEYWSDTVEVRSIKFNPKLPDSLFELTIPQNVEVYDGLTGLGWLPPGERPAALFPAEARARKWLWIASAVLGAFIVLAPGVYLTRRRGAMG